MPGPVRIAGTEDVQTVLGRLAEAGRFAEAGRMPDSGRLADVGRLAQTGMRTEAGRQGMQHGHGRILSSLLFDLQLRYVSSEQHLGMGQGQLRP